MAENLKEKTTRGLFWGALNSGSTQILQLLIGIMLGRLLSPGEYGIIGYVAIFSAIAGNLQSSGFSTYLINMKDPKQEDYNAVFWFNVITSFSLYIILFLFSPLIAEFFHQPVLTNVSHYIFITFVLGAFGIVPNAYMTRKLMVKESTIMNTIAITVSGIVGVSMAFTGCSYWSLIVQQIIYIFILNIGRYYYIDWRPSFHIDLRPIKKMFLFSINILITMIINTVSINIMSLILGKLFNKEVLGNYSQAYKWNTMAYSIVSTTINQVAQPVFASISEQKERERKVFRKIIRFTALISFPAMFGLAVVSNEFILLTIGPKWADSIPLLQILCISGAFFPFSTVYQNLIISQGRSDINMWCNILQIIIQIVLLLFTYKYGMLIMIATYSAFNILWLGAWHIGAHKLIGLKFSDILKDVSPFLIISMVTMTITWIVTRNITNIGLLLVSRVILSVVIYSVIMKLAKIEIFEECIMFLRTKIKK